MNAKYIIVKQIYRKALIYLKAIEQKYAGIQLDTNYNTYHIG